MPFQSYAVDDSVTQFSEGAPRLPEGDYLAELTSVRPSREDYDGNPYHTFLFRTYDGPDGGRGKSIGYVTSMNPEKFWNLGRVFQSLGVSPESALSLRANSYREHAAIAEKLTNGLKGRKTGISVTDRETDARIVSNIAGFFDVAEWEIHKPREYKQPVLAGKSNGPVPTPSQPLASPATNTAFASALDALFTKTAD